MRDIILSVNKAWNDTSNWLKYLLSISYVFNYLRTISTQNRTPFGIMDSYLKSSPFFRWSFKSLYIPKNNWVINYEKTFNVGVNMALFLKKIGHFNEGTYNQAVQLPYSEQDKLIPLLTNLHNAGVLTEDNCRQSFLKSK